MDKKTYLVLIALIGVGLFALPQTTALFAGQHGFVNIDPTGNQIECTKCHGDIQAELHSELSTVTGTDGPHAAMKCEYCHRLQIGQSSGDNAYAIVEYQGLALNLSDVNSSDPSGYNKTTARRYLVMKTADYESGYYPAIVNNTPSETTVGVAASGSPNYLFKKGATAGGSLSPLFRDVSVDSSGYNYSATVFAWNNTISNRARQTDVIVNGIGTVTYVARGTIYPLYNAGAPIDTNDTTKDTAFNPALVTWASTFINSTSGLPEAITSPTTQPTIILDGAGSRTVNSGSKYHAASLVACMDCHAGSSPQPGHETARLGQTNYTDEEFCENCHYGTELPGSIRTYQLSAGGFGGITNEAFDAGTAEVHNGIVKTKADNIAVGVFGGRVIPANNAACIACHTHVDVEITYSRPTTLTFNAVESNSGNWTESGYSSTINGSVNNGGVSTG